MTVTVLFGGLEADLDLWADPLRANMEASPLTFEFIERVGDARPEDVDYLIYAPIGPIGDLRGYVNLKAVLSLWAGVETIMRRPDLPDAPIIRMAEPGLVEGMREYVVGHVLRAHLGVARQQAAQAERRWDESLASPLARDRRVGVLGLGNLGVACAEALARLGFQVAGWSRTPKDVPNVESFAGTETLRRFLQRSDILVCLLPLTPATRGLLDAEAFAALPEGAHIINAGRGPVIDEDALLASLENHLGSATLDVFEDEPLPPENPLWRHTNVLITPHIASLTRPATASQYLISQIEKLEAGEAVANTVDRSVGY